MGTFQKIGLSQEKAVNFTGPRAWRTQGGLSQNGSIRVDFGMRERSSEEEDLKGRIVNWAIGGGVRQDFKW